MTDETKPSQLPPFAIPWLGLALGALGGWASGQGVALGAAVGAGVGLAGQAMNRKARAATLEAADADGDGYVNQSEAGEAGLSWQDVSAYGVATPATTFAAAKGLTVAVAPAGLATRTPSSTVSRFKAPVTPAELPKVPALGALGIVYS